MPKAVFMPANSKFSKNELHAKAIIKNLRLGSNLSMIAGADLLSITVKNLEDIEATRNYGCHLSWDTMLMVSRAYCVPLTHFIA